MNTVDWLLLVLILDAVLLAVVSLRRQRKNGRGCCGTCSSCSCGCKSQKSR